MESYLSNPPMIIIEMIVLNTSSLTDYFYNERNLLSESISQDLLEDRFSGRRILEYDQNNNIISTITQIHVDGSWVNELRWVSIFNSDGVRIEVLRQFWNGSEWIVDDGFLYEYYATGELKSVLGRGWDGQNWRDGFLESYEYTQSGLRTLHLFQWWDGWQWVNQTRDIKSYDGEKIISHIYQKAASAQQNWTNDLKREYEYPNDSTDITYVSFWQDSIWDISLRDFNSYDKQDNLIRSVGQRFEDSTWVNIGMGTFEYNLDNQQTLDSNFQWNGQEFVKISDIITTYTSRGNMLSETVKEWQGADYRIKSIRNNIYETISSDEDLIYNEKELVIYPNPSSGEFILTHPTGIKPNTIIQIFTMDGTIVFEKEISESQEQLDMNLNHFQSGTFVIRYIHGLQSEMSILVIQ